MTIGILKEPSDDHRVSLLPEQAEALIKKNVTILLETGAGNKAFAPDEVYASKGVRIAGRIEVLNASDVVLSIQLLTPDDISQLKRGAVVLGVYQPLINTNTIREWSQQGLTTFSMDMIPRTTRAQSMDVLSSQANIAGYRAVVLAAGMFPRYFPMFMTAAGSIAPAKVLILGAGVAGLQAVATARRLGAVVEVFDTRPAVKEEVMSLGAKFVEVEGAADASTAGGYAVDQTEEYKQKQQQKITEAIAKADVVITTAQIPGKKAPILITEAMLNGMRNGSLIMDLAAATGGNTPFTRNNETVVYNNVTIVGNSNLAAGMPSDASKLYGKNILNFLNLMIDKDGTWNLNWEDDLVKGTCITFNGELVNERVRQLV
ncbi:Re/Si-specific NAD(P)(+) transhydrogenase subunit alpha [Segetibacter sp. 3557_3]|uniref:Re/Si-specific NAD(P)(+) transhydrogenase subunit alpha n=1 Tax=Segetibacter sp. 3557_3 TaxID=2547429 RepID=UPI0010586CEB|nr:Re/Si-specific NAD(P)(+) transhydrogenase subunit alpha [Segetibacter sp. 3557_3]TDH21447.1 Re/Si-specific NAD(P)(+) transhydrogenase subunit alpha [Segetibacter sp. 3557_3]